MKVEILFPEVCNLYGDLQNVYYLKRSCPELEIAETDLHSKPRFLDEDVALVYMGSTTEQGLALAAEALRPSSPPGCPPAAAAACSRRPSARHRRDTSRHRRSKTQSPCRTSSWGSPTSFSPRPCSSSSPAAPSAPAWSGYSRSSGSRPARSCPWTSA